MALTSIRRRISALETVIRPVFDYPPLTPAEIEAIASRVRAGDSLEAEEVDRLMQHSPVFHGEYLITAYNREVTVNRCVGIDFAEL